MSLIVYAFKMIDSKVVNIDDEPEIPSNRLFGTESSRHSIWGSTPLKDIGCVILPRLKYEDIYCTGTQLIAFEKELKLIASKTEALNKALRIDNDYLSFRIKNALAAVEVAKQHENGGVYIG